MSTGRITRSATGALTKRDNNAPVVSFAGEQKEADNPDGTAVPAKKRAATTKAESAPKRKKAAPSTSKPVKAAKKPKATIAKRGWALPHGMGSAELTADNTEIPPDDTEAESPAANAIGRVDGWDASLSQADDDKDVLMSDNADMAVTHAPAESPAAEAGTAKAPKRPTRRAAKKIKFEDSGESDSKMDDLDGDDDKSRADFKPRNKRGTTNKYGLTRGYSPYPHRTVPTPEQCEEVHRILVETHGAVIQPPKAPPPSIKVTGCGEVPSVLDALLRTRISANTLMENSNRAIEQLAETYGLATYGIGTGSIDWNAVRLGSTEKLITAIRVAGTPKLKAGHIKTILDMVHEEQKVRAHAHLEGAPVPGAQNEDDGQKALEVQKALDDYLSLEHMRAMTADEAITEFVKYPGIAVKTAACVVLFCLQIPCFAVDTHVHKMCKWLGWVPEKANETDTFNHGEHMVPDHLKYALHQLFIRHGQDCFKCRKNTKPGTKAWNEAPDCPLEHLLDRNKAAAKGGEEDDAEVEGAADGEGEVEGAPAGTKTKNKRGKGKKKAAKGKVEDKVAAEEEVAEDEGEVESGTVDTKKKNMRGKGKKKATKVKVEDKVAAEEELAADGDGQDQLTSPTTTKNDKGTRPLIEQRWDLRPRRVI
jgi:endonuclease III